MGRRIVVALITLVLAWGMVYYYHGVLIGIRIQEMRDANAAGGIWSDLYPRWVGAQGLLRHRRNPYSAEVTAEIERGFYGRPLDRSGDRSNPDREIDPEEFAYPVYVVFLLAPFLGFPFQAVGLAFTVLLFVITPASLWLWMSALNLRLRPRVFAFALIASMSSFPVIDGLHLQQLSLLVVALMAGAMAALVKGRLVLAGLFLGVAMIKPQLVIPCVVLVLVWVLGDWGGRKWFAIAFGGVMAALLIGAEIVLPGWLWMWRRATHSYITHHRDSFMVAIFHPRTAMMIAVAAIITLMGLFWRVRNERPGSGPFSFALVAALVLTVIFMPNGGSYYNETLLLPVVLWAVAYGSRMARKKLMATALGLIVAIILAGEWVTALAVSLSVLILHWSFRGESTLFIVGPQFLAFFFPLFLGLFVAICGPWAFRPGLGDEPTIG